MPTGDLVIILNSSLVRYMRWKLAKMDAIFKNICMNLQWEFIPSIYGPTCEVF